MPESAVLEEPRTRARDEKGRLLPKPSTNGQPEQSCPINADLVQIHMDSVSKDVFLPTVKPGQTPMVTNKAGKQEARLSCELDEAGRVVPFSGPVFTDHAAAQLWEMVKPHIEHFAGFARRQMSECLLVPGAQGEIDDRAKVIQIPKGRFVFVPDGQQTF